MKIITHRALIGFLLLFSFSCLKAQIKNEILSYSDSTDIIMNNGKELMMQSLMSGNDEKAKEIYYYMQDEAIKRGFLAFSYIDILYINALSHNWGEFFDYIKNFKEKVNLPIYDREAQFSDRLYNITKQKAGAILYDAKKVLPEEEYATLELFLHVVQEDDLSSKYRKLKNDFEHDFTSSKYEEFVDNYLPDLPMKASWTCSFGSGFMSPTGTFGDHFKTTASFYMSTDFNISNVYFSLFLDGSNLRVDEPFTIENYQFEKNDRFAYFDGGLQLGYFLVNSNYIHLAPYATIAGSSLESNLYSDYENNDMEYHMINAFTCGAGVHTQIKLFEAKSNPYSGFWYGIYYDQSVEYYFALKCNIGYNVLTSSNYDVAKGDMFYAQIGIVWGLGGF